MNTILWIFAIIGFLIIGVLIVFVILFGRSVTCSRSGIEMLIDDPDFETHIIRF